ncbi:cytidylyltransferase domain-containing protein [Nitrosopumilus ureiphilus]|uniref:Acylneuraminate cytidylyltransferase n=1 Tax=Nitrosopumilus ureiphilus TaxID=1470067 RepID=A0A7D5RA57_9ARCH|nr:glycosyltransferase family protein [Nitrosopumilus ureiphilus]QLH05762.1 acylneuraminate cytidylyltransferase [Nitrosopumilus ureiphilus]
MIGCIIQARIGSSRLPGKTLMKLDKKNTVLDFVINQLSYSKLIETIVIATTDLKEDDVIEIFAKNLNINIFRGNSNDVVDRYFQCAKKFSIDTIVRITADNPLIDPNIIDLVIDEYCDKKCDFATNTLHRTFPYGTEVEVFSFEVIEKTWFNAKKPSEREHVTPFIRDPQNKFYLVNVENYEDLSKIRYTVDRREDLKLIKEIIKNINTKPILLKHIIELYQTKPNIFKINENVKHDGYITSLKKDQQYFKSHNEDNS